MARARDVGPMDPSPVTRTRHLARMRGDVPSWAMFFQSWSDLLRVVVVGTLAYGALVLLLRASGKRTLSKLNAFDLVVTVALGSTLATVLLSRDVALVEGVHAFGLLIGLQALITWASVRSRRVSRLVKAEPALLLFEGRLLEDAMRRERVTEDEILAAIRASGRGDVTSVRAVVMETAGELSVIGGLPAGDERALEQVRGDRTPPAGD